MNRNRVYIAIVALIGLLAPSVYSQTTTPSAEVPPDLPRQDVEPQELLQPVTAGSPETLPRVLSEPRIHLDTAILNRGMPVKGEFFMSDPLPAEAVALDVQVYDSLGRVLARQTLPPAQMIADDLSGVVRAVPFEVQVPAVLAMRHYVKITALDGDKKPVTAIAAFLYYPAPPWQDYTVNMWQRFDVQRYPAMKKLYITGGEWSGYAPEAPAGWVDENWRWYVESTGNWCFSAYHHVYPDKKPVNYEYQEIKKQFIADRTNMRLLERDPCLSDPVMQMRIWKQFRDVATINHAYEPLFYTIGDEAGIADQAAPFDFCFSPFCQERFRAWLRERYKTLDALNAEWDTHYTGWPQVMGETTDQVFARKDDNFSQWCDFKDFMDSVQTAGYDLAKSALREGDATAHLGMGGAQGPEAVGDWDFWKLTRVMDCIEAYWIGNNYEIIRSFAPNCILLHTDFPNLQYFDNGKLMIWRTFFQGDKALYLWMEDKNFVDSHGQPNELAQKLAPIFKEMTGGIGMLRFNSPRRDDPIAIYESQNNLRVQWVLEVRPEGEKWIDRTSRSERVDSEFLRRRESWVKLIEDNGYQFRFISPQMAESDLVPYDPATGNGYRVLILPRMAALSTQEGDAIRKFVNDGGTVLADGMPGEFDEHGKKLAKSSLADLFAAGAGHPTVLGKGRALLLDQDVLPYYLLRCDPKNPEIAMRDYIGGLLHDAIGDQRVTPIITGEDGKSVTGVETTLWENGKAQLVAVCRNPLHNISELGAAEHANNKKFETPITLVLHSRMPRAWYDMRSGKSLGTASELKIDLQPFEPAFYASYPAPAGDFQVTADPAARKIAIHPAADCPMAKDVFHLDFVAPDGQEALVYRQNVLVDPAGSTFELPLALSDAAGGWTLHVKEVTTGKEVAAPFAWGK